MKRIFVNEKWCLGCHLCEYNCAFANSCIKDMVKALKNKDIYPAIQVEGKDNINFAVSCRHCQNPICVESCISGALSIKDGAVCIDHDLCVSCLTCILVCPYGAVIQDGSGVVQKCQHCLENNQIPACVQGCPNKAIVYEER